MRVQIVFGVSIAVIPFEPRRIDRRFYGEVHYLAEQFRNGVK